MRAEATTVPGEGWTEEKIEKTLEALNDRWRQIEFKMAPYMPSRDQQTAVPLLSIAEDDFKTLETDQLTVQDCDDQAENQRWSLVPVETKATVEV